ncbi:MAG: hypothetical protein O7J95_13375, partial [Planctomycetota bacterium]|nr:hypothetical protein [Planctomycetota bacterium]
MDWFLVTVKVVSGAFLFLIGVRFLANGLLLILSPYVHLQSGRWRERRLPGYLGGVLSGATFQSWSTVASHLVSFANGGFLTARGGLFLLLGSSLGATVLPQVLSLELGFLTIPFLAAGLFCLILPRQSGRNTWAWVFLGGGLVLASWSLLTEGIDLLAVSESFREEVLPASVVYSAGFGRLVSSFAAIFFLGLGIGFLLRTSNLVVILGILLATHGVITPASGVPLIVGANVGSALMVFLRSLLKNREARKLAACGAVFHVLTALVVVLLCLVPVGNSALYLWLVEWLTPGRLFHPIPESVGHHLAMAHTLYHLLGGVAFLAAPRVLLRLAERLFPSGGIEKQVKPHSLDENLIPFASLAIRQVTQEVVYLAQLSSKSVAESFDAFRYGDIKLADQVARRQETIADVHRDVTRYLVEVGENQLSRHDACHLEVLQSATTEVVRIGECAEGLRDVTVRRLEEGVDASEDMDREFGEVYDLVMAQFDNIATLLERPDQRAEEGAMKVVERLAKYRTRLETQSRQRLEQNEGGPGKSGVEIHMQSLIYHQAFDLLFRIASHLA